jgi:hypothetical protein
MSPKCFADSSRGRTHTENPCQPTPGNAFNHLIFQSLIQELQNKQMPKTA